LRILAVEDDELLGDALQAGLRQAGFAVDWATDGISAEQHLAATTYAAMVLDLGLPRRSGLDVLARLRRNGNPLPVLVLTARDTVKERIAGLDRGADDYVIKPFVLAEVAARLRALIRRAEGKPQAVIAHAGVVLDPGAHTVSVDGRAVELGAKEFALLNVLMLNAGRVLSRTQLEEQLYSWADEAGSNTIEVYIHHLRKKLGRDVIKTIRGVGYLLPKEGV
jgi:DNA-binding response OmpR family regulator